MWSGQSWTSVRPKLREKASASSAKNVPIYPSSKCYLSGVSNPIFKGSAHDTKSDVVPGTLTQTVGCLSRTLRPSLTRWPPMPISDQTSFSQTHLILHMHRAVDCGSSLCNPLKRCLSSHSKIFGMWPTLTWGTAILKASFDCGSYELCSIWRRILGFHMSFSFQSDRVTVFCIPQVQFRQNWVNWKICRNCAWTRTNFPVLSPFFSLDMYSIWRKRLAFHMPILAFG